MLLFAAACCVCVLCVCVVLCCVSVCCCVFLSVGVYCCFCVCVVCAFTCVFVCVRALSELCQSVLIFSLWVIVSEVDSSDFCVVLLAVILYIFTQS